MSAFILYQDDHWLAVNKPIGMETDGKDRCGRLGAMEWLKLHHSFEIEKTYSLNFDESGVLLFSKSEQPPQELQLTFEFTFWSDKCFTPRASEAASIAVTFMSSQGPFHCYTASVSSIQKATLRKTLSTRGLPVLGDVKQGGAPFHRVCIHCSRIESKPLNRLIECPLPPSFELLKQTQDEGRLSLSVCQDRRLAWLSSITNAFRVVHRDEVKHAAYAAEIYGDYLSVSSYDEHSTLENVIQSLSPDIETLMTVYGCKGALIRLSNRDPHHKKLVSASHWIGQKKETPFFIQEHGLNYEIQLAEDKHTGLFLDQRDTRRRVAQVAFNKRMANLFSFTCSFSQVAIQARADIVFSVDLASGCLQRGKSNLAQNGLDHFGIGKFVKEDVRLWLRRQLRRKKEGAETYRPFDLIICDPPVFASGKKKGQSFSVQEAWPELVEGCSGILKNGGIAVFANNHRAGEECYYRSILETHFKTVTCLSQPLDFPASRALHSRTYWCEA